MRDAERVEALFRRSSGAFRFARWGRPPAPVFFGLGKAEEESFSAAIGLAAAITGVPVQPRDEELGFNYLVFLCDRWGELPATPGLDRLIPDLGKLVSVLTAAGANQYRIFGFDELGAIRICITLLRADADLRSAPFSTLALSQAAQSLLLWSDHAFRDESPVRVGPAGAMLDPWFAALIRAAYAPDAPCASDDAAEASRIADRMVADHP